MMAASYVVAYKMVAIGPILETGAIFLFPFSFTIADIVAEIYGYTISKQLIWASALGGIIFCLAIKGVIALDPLSFWHHQSAYNQVLGHIDTIYWAMIIATVVSSFVNVRLILRWRFLLQGKHFWLRSIGSSGVGELLFSIIAGSISFIGVEPATKIFWLMFNGFVFKLVYAIIAAFPSNLAVLLLKRYEYKEVQKSGLSFNPFSDFKKEA